MGLIGEYTPAKTKTDPREAELKAQLDREKKRVQRELREMKKLRKLFDALPQDETPANLLGWLVKTYGAGETFGPPETEGQ